MPNTIQFHRVLTTTPDKLYKAFIDPEAMVKWLPPHGFTGKVTEMNATVGGSYKMSFTNFGTGSSHSFGGTYVTLEPGKKIQYIDRFDSPDMPGEMTVTVLLKKVSCGTELHITQADIPDMIPPEMCYLGWQQSLAMLAHLVEPNIPDQG
ncbi:MAG: SRPBCC family protein [Candidatus Margulisiibacteriota bacterium]